MNLRGIGVGELVGDKMESVIVEQIETVTVLINLVEVNGVT